MFSEGKQKSIKEIFPNHTCVVDYETGVNQFLDLVCSAHVFAIANGTSLIDHMKTNLFTIMHTI